MNRAAFRWATLVLCAAAGRVAGSEGLAILTFDPSGRLTFNEVPTATLYRVEWASQPAGVWQAGAPGLTGLCARGYGIMDVTVGVSAAACFYRVVATVTNVPPPAPDGMVYIPGGTNSGTDPEIGAYSLTVNAFHMDRHEVTLALWSEVRNWSLTNGYAYDNAGTGNATNHPVHTVSWSDCVKWCNARSERAGRTPVYYTDYGLTQVYRAGQVPPQVMPAANGYRLPTDTEWHYAARGGVADRRFPWADSDWVDHSRANYYSFWSGGVPYYAYDHAVSIGWHPLYAAGGKPYTSPVGSFAPNGFGLYDMAGNLFEWCVDWYPGQEGKYRVLRGGSWDSHACYCQSAYRSYGAGTGYYLIGFRTVLPAGPP